jgi:hypothetical protein
MTQLPSNFVKARKMGQDFKQAEYSQFFTIPPGIHAGGSHLLAADTYKPGAGVSLPKLSQQSAAQLVA